MPIHNSDIADIFEAVADLLEIEGSNVYRVRAYRNAARTVADLSRSLREMVSAGEDLTELPSIGKDLAAKIEEIVRTGSLSYLEELERRTPPSIREVLRVPGLGPKQVKALHEKLGISDLSGLERAAREGEIRELSGFGRKSEQKIIQELERQAQQERRTSIHIAEQVVEPLVEYLRHTEGVKDVAVAGSYRRRMETVGDLDVLAVCSQSAMVMESFTAYEDVVQVLSRGETRASVWFRSGLQVDLRAVPERSFGAALHYFTGSKAHNIAIRERAQAQGLKVNEYGVFRGDEQVSGRTEEEVYQAVGLPWITPELREDRGEIEAADSGALPRLIARDRIRGDLHAHTDASDGLLSLEGMAEAARARGHEYLAITDHSKSVRVANGLTAERLAEEIELIDRLNEELEGIVLLKGIEVDILGDGSLDLPNPILGELDLRVCSIHSKFGLSEEEQTERILRAMDNPLFNILAHPTGRLVQERPPYAVDLERVIEAAAERGVHMELNASPHRLDLTDIYCKMAKDLGVRVSISTDAHRAQELDHMRFGIGQARRGWLEPKDVLNTCDVNELKALLKR